VGTRKLGTWERRTGGMGLAWSKGLEAVGAASGTLMVPEAEIDVASGDVPEEPAPSPSVLAELLPVLQMLEKPAPPPGLLGRCIEEELSKEGDPVAQERGNLGQAPVQRPEPPCWGLLDPGQEPQASLDFDKFEFPWDMSIGHAYYRDRRFKKALLKHLMSTSAFSLLRSCSHTDAEDDAMPCPGNNYSRCSSSDLDSDTDDSEPEITAEQRAESWYESQHRRLTEPGRPAESYHIPADEEEDLARRYTAYKKWEEAYPTQLATYQTQLRQIEDFSAFEFPPDVLIDRGHWADPRLQAAIMRRMPDLTDAEYEGRQRWCSILTLGTPPRPKKDVYRVSVEEDYLLKKWDEIERVNMAS
jgi:hypothetical protein